MLDGVGFERSSQFHSPASMSCVTPDSVHVLGDSCLAVHSLPVPDPHTRLQLFCGSSLKMPHGSPEFGLFHRHVCHGSVLVQLKVTGSSLAMSSVGSAPCAPSG